MATEEKVGIVDGYYAKIGVAAVRLTDGALQVGDQIRIHGHTTDFTQTVESMQIEHKPIQRAERGSDIALKVRDRVRPHDHILKVVAP
ncbi:MAG: translation elongation factor-like protein [Candidatus Rokubacteria bacterium]|nr:translation elongation factor-like protein [Candidatus Rokubacteria bacterium]MBI2554402.1 translation elongation factor-like protein [Candidatus Rokubacteria bacterium]